MSDRGRNSQLVRLISIVRDLDRLGGVTIAELANNHSVTTRTIRRDLDALRDAGLDLKLEDGERGKRRRADFKAPVREFAKLMDRNHYLALTLAMGQGGAARATGTVYAQLEDLLGKIEAALPPADRSTLAAIADSFHSWEKFAWRRAPPDVLWKLVGAIAEKRLCKVKYCAARAEAKARQYTVLPLKLFAHDGAAYLLCHVPKHDSTITLNLTRLDGLDVTSQRGQAPANFDPAQFENAAFGVTRGGPAETWRLRFDPTAAPFIRERTWHPTQVAVDLPDGGLELSFTCEGGVEVFAWVASWHSCVEVLAPARARTDLAAFGAWLGDTYADAGAG